MPTVIMQEQPDTEDATALITELDEILTPLYPNESRHGYSIDKLVCEGVAFFVMRHEGMLAGCGGIKLVDKAYGELKRMYVRPQFRGQGLSKLMVNHLADYAKQYGVTVLRLETGIHQKEAIGLYEGMGFQRIAPFGPYREDPLSLCYEKRIV